MTVKLEGQLEVDIHRGVIYFHNNKNGCTTLRICRLYIPETFDEDMQLDITCNDKTTVMSTVLPPSKEKMEKIEKRAWANKDRASLNLIQAIRKKEKPDE
jgi:hypothetical protein